MAKRIAHLSTLHPANDTRIFLKECLTLAEAGYEVTLVARAPRAAFDTGPVQVVEISVSGGRLARMMLGPIKILRTAIALRAEMYHFHDPELIPVGFILKAFGKRVIYDVHEDVPAQIMSKEWIPTLLRRPIAGAVSLVHRIANSIFDGIVVAREDAAEAFHGPHVALVQNYPLMSEIDEERDAGVRPSSDPYKIAYVGGVTEVRGIYEMVAAVEILAQEYNVVLELAGPMYPALRAECEKLPGWKHVHYYEWVDRKQMSAILADSVAALLLFHPIPNHITSYPNKLFEYMGAGIPVVASNFPYWHQFIQEVGSGIMVNPTDPEEIADALRTIIENPNAAQYMGEVGAKAVRERWSWDSEAQRLLGLVESIIGEP